MIRPRLEHLPRDRRRPIAGRVVASALVLLAMVTAGAAEHCHFGPPPVPAVAPPMTLELGPVEAAPPESMLFRCYSVDAPTHTPGVVDLEGSSLDGACEDVATSGKGPDSSLVSALIAAI